MQTRDRLVATGWDQGCSTSCLFNYILPEQKDYSISGAPKQENGMVLKFRMKVLTFIIRHYSNS